MHIRCLAMFFAIALLSGCAAYDGRGLVAGTSTAGEVEALMGQPAARVATPGGGAVLYYPRGPLGRESFAVVLGADGKMRAIEQRLTDANIARLALGSSTTAQVRELLGPPPTTSTLPRLQREVWEYRMGDSTQPFYLYVQFSSDGIVREVLKLPEYNGDSPSDCSC